MNPQFSVSLKGVVPLKFCPDFGEIVNTLNRLGLAAFEDSLLEFMIE